MLRLAFDFIITWRETRTRPNAYVYQTLLYDDSAVKKLVKHPVPPDVAIRTK